jgi:hypothetical protein
MLESFFGSSLKVLQNDFFGIIFFWDICLKSTDLSDYFCIIRVSQGFFSILNLFLHSKMDFK